MRIAFCSCLFVLVACVVQTAAAHGIPMAVDVNPANQLFASELVHFNAPEGTFAPSPAAAPVALAAVAAFHPVFGGNIPAGTVLSVNAAGSAAHPSALAYWDGGDVLPSPKDIAISRSGFNIVVQSDDELVAGGALSAYSGLEGGHSSVTLALPLDAPVGLYAVGFQLSGPSYETSETFWAIANNGVDPSKFDAGVAAIAAAVPEPSAMALGLAGCVALVTLRRRVRVRQ
ncbi:MAG: hypothetical protein SGJ19_25765 [Planctomycetia bacterium]|nr:hypothetical protein [Planctomycetia bacterium]